MGLALRVGLEMGYTYDTETTSGDFMGIHDREYYKSEEAGIQFAASQWSTVTKLIVLTAGFYVADLFTGRSHWLMTNMAAQADSFLKPYLWWQWVSYGFAHSTRDISHIFWNMFGLWIFGKQVEDVYGPKEFLRIYLVSMVLGGFVWAARSAAMQAGAPLVGASGAVTAITLLFCLHFPKNTVLLMMVLPVPAWLLGILIIGGNLMGLKASGENIAFDVHLVGAAFALAYFYFGWSLSSWLPSWPSFSGSRGWWSGRWGASRPRLRVHRPVDEPAERAHSEDRDLARLVAQGDQLLQKIKDHGIDSLSDKERRVLDEYSRRLRNR